MASMTQETAHICTATVKAKRFAEKALIIEKFIENASSHGRDQLTIDMSKSSSWTTTEVPELKRYFEKKGFKVIVNTKLFSKRPNYVIIKW